MLCQVRNTKGGSSGLADGGPELDECAQGSRCITGAQRGKVGSPTCQY